MPSSPLPRLFALTNYVKRYPGATSNQILSYLDSRDFDISGRTMERDLKRLREDFFVDIVYHRSNNGYTISEHSLGYVQDLCVFAEYFHSTELLRTILDTGVSRVDVIDMDSQGELQGAEWLDVLITAITSKKNLILHYQSFDQESPHYHDLSPWLLKYYQGRWYVVGNTKHGQSIFGVDRILKVEPSSSKYIPCYTTPRTIFKQQIGIYYSEDPPVEVRFLATSKHAKYLSTLPMHSSQKHIGKCENWEEFTLNVKINFELVQNFLMAGDRVKVLKPNTLIRELRREIKKMYGYYFHTDK